MIQSPFVNEKISKQVLPLISEYENKIKQVIVYYSLHLLPRIALNTKVDKLVKEFSNKIDKIPLIDKTYYVNSLKTTSNKLIERYYNDFAMIFFTLSLIARGTLKNKQNMVSLYKESQNIIKQVKDNQIDKQEQHKIGYVDIKDYANKIKDKLKELALEDTMAIDESSKTTTSLFSHIELELRHNYQLETIKKAQESDSDLYYLSSHIDSSERCEKWQGKVVSMTLLSIDNSMWTGQYTKRHEKIYSFNDITNQVDKYGYKNNIIVGFNCRHTLIKYGDKIVPDKFSTASILRERKINDKMREMERRIRKLKSLASEYKLVDKRMYNKLNVKISDYTKQYKEYANKHEYPYYEYRIM